MTFFRWNRETDETYEYANFEKDSEDELVRRLGEMERIRRTPGGFEKERRVAKTQVGPYEVSTVFLGIDHNFLGRFGGEPILFETMIFARHRTFDYQQRYHTGKEAQAGHDQLVGRLRWLLKTPQVSRKRIDQIMRQL
jgi:hypothetical protein